MVLKNYFYKFENSYGTKKIKNQSLPSAGSRTLGKASQKYIWSRTHARTYRASPFSADRRRRPVWPQRRLGRNAAWLTSSPATPPRPAARLPLATLPLVGGSLDLGRPAPGRRLARSRLPRPPPAVPPRTDGSPSTCSSAPNRRIAGARSRRGVLVHAQHVRGRQLVCRRSYICMCRF